MQINKRKDIAVVKDFINFANNMRLLPFIIVIALIVGCTNPERDSFDIKPHTEMDSASAVTTGIILNFDTTIVEDKIDLDIY